MKEIISDTIEETCADINMDKSIVFAVMPSKSAMYVLKLFGAGDSLSYRFQNIGNIRTKLTSGMNTIEGSIAEALEKGCKVYALDGVWQLALLIGRFSTDQDSLNDEVKMGAHEAAHIAASPKGVE